MGWLDIARSLKAGGLTGIAAMAVIFGLQRVGVTLTMEQATAIVGLIITGVTYLVPDSKKQQIVALAKSLDVSAEHLAANLPDIQASYPNQTATPAATGQPNGNFNH